MRWTSPRKTASLAIKNGNAARRLKNGIRDGRCCSTSEIILAGKSSIGGTAAGVLFHSSVESCVDCHLSPSDTGQFFAYCAGNLVKTSETTTTSPRARRQG